MQKENMTLETRFDDAQRAIWDIQAELGDLAMALDEITNDYDSNLTLNARDALEYANGKTDSSVGQKSCEFLCEHKRIMWLVHTARTYCEQAQKLCEGASA